jgi:hypothetical protein
MKKMVLDVKKNIRRDLVKLGITIKIALGFMKNYKLMLQVFVYYFYKQIKIFI